MKKLVLAAALLALSESVAIAGSAGSAPSFARARSYTTGHGPSSVALGDLNGDGRPDLVTANYDEVAGSISVLLSRGGGGFKTKVDYSTGRDSHSVAIGDLDGDGKEDLAITNYRGHSVSVLINTGDGSFPTKRDYRIRSKPTSVAISDLNGDGRPDLVTANGEMNTVSVLLNVGDGFQPQADYRTGNGPGSLAVANLNGDRRPDVVTANAAAATVSVLFNTGDGSFRARRDYRTGRRSAEPAPVAVAIGDVNGDRKPDLTTANYGDANTVSVLANMGDGSFRARREYRTGRLPASVAIGDLNGDGKPDLTTANQAGDNLSVLVNRGDGSFQTKLDFAYGRGPVWVAIGDLNSDRRTDLVTANGDANTLSVLLNTPGLCTVQDVRKRTLPTAKRTIARGNCRVGRIRRAHSKTVKRGRVISEHPDFGTVLPGGAKVDLVVSR